MSPDTFINENKEYSPLPRIANLCRLDVNEINPDDLKYIYDLLEYLHDGNITNAERESFFKAELNKNREVVYKYLQRPLLEATEREVIEYKQELRQLIEAALNFLSTAISFGTHYPTHLPVIEKYIKRGAPFNTLLIGSLTPSSQNEYEQLKRISALITPYTVDIETALTGAISEGGFTIANGRQLPFRSGSMNIIFTSCLFRDTNSLSGLHYNDIYAILFETYRCLSTQGTVSLVEMPFDDEKVFLDIIYTILRIIGFTKIKISKARSYDYRNFTNQNVNDISIDSDVISIIASK